MALASNQKVNKIVCSFGEATYLNASATLNTVLPFTSPATVGVANAKVAYFNATVPGGPDWSLTGLPARTTGDVYGRWLRDYPFSGPPITSGVDGVPRSKIGARNVSAFYVLGPQGSGVNTTVQAQMQLLNLGCTFVAYHNTPQTAAAVSDPAAAPGAEGRYFRLRAVAVRLIAGTALAIRGAAYVQRQHSIEV